MRVLLGPVAVTTLPRMLGAGDVDVEAAADGAVEGAADGAADAPGVALFNAVR